MSNTSWLDLLVVAIGDSGGRCSVGMDSSGDVSGGSPSLAACAVLLEALWETLLYDCLMSAMTAVGAVVVSGDELTHLGESS